VAPAACPGGGCLVPVVVPRGGGPPGAVVSPCGGDPAAAVSPWRSSRPGDGPRPRLSRRGGSRPAAVVTSRQSPPRRLSYPGGCPRPTLDRPRDHHRVNLFVPLPLPLRDSPTTAPCRPRLGRRPMGVLGECVSARQGRAIERATDSPGRNSPREVTDRGRGGRGGQAAPPGHRSSSPPQAATRLEPPLARRGTFPPHHSPPPPSGFSFLPYRAKSIERVSRITVTLICPGYVISASTLRAMSFDSQIACSSLIFSESTMMRTSRPAWMA
jgi:hypothetical protein